MKVHDFIPEFMEALKAQLEDDDKRWGDTWLEKTKASQEDRIFHSLNGYYSNWADNNIPIPWLKIAGNAMIAWIRENHPELWEE